MRICRLRLELPPRLEAQMARRIFTFFPSGLFSKRYWLDSAGQASLELIGMMPLLMLAALLAFQLMAFGYAATMVGNAAEAASMAALRGESTTEAAAESVPGWPKSSISVDREGERVEVSLTVPSPFDFLEKKLKVSADATVRKAGLGQ